MFFPDEPVPVEVVRELAALLKTNGLSELTLESKAEENALRLSLGRETRAYATAPVSSQTIAAESASYEASEAAALQSEAEVLAAEAQNNTREVGSPCVGVYRAPKKPLQVGDSVRSGQVVAIVESLHVPNEVVAPVDGKVLEIPVVAGEGIEWGQTLLVLQPAS